jgi:hypothetical protein
MRAGLHFLLPQDATRVSRAANIELDSIREELKDITDGERAQGDLLVARRTELLAAGDEDQLPRVTSKSGAPQESFSPPLIGTVDMANLVLGSGFGQQTWRLASSVVHAKDRSILELVAGRGDIDLSRPGLGQSMGVPYLGSCLVVMTESYKDVAQYMGRGTPVLDLAVQNVFWTLEAMNGKHDDALLDKAGIDRTGWV